MDTMTSYAILAIVVPLILVIGTAAWQLDNTLREILEELRRLTGGEGGNDSLRHSSKLHIPRELHMSSLPENRSEHRADTADIVRYSKTTRTFGA